MIEVECGVGCQLSRIIPKWAVDVGKGCSCRDYALKMDRWGPDRCDTEYREKIVGHLLNQSDLLVPMFRAVPKKLKRFIAHQLLNRAIASAREKA